MKRGNFLLADAKTSQAVRFEMKVADDRDSKVEHLVSVCLRRLSSIDSAVIVRDALQGCGCI